MKIRLALLVTILASALGAAERLTVPLDGAWQITDSRDGSILPTRYDHTVPVPGLAHSSTPPFADVDRFDSRQVIQNRVAKGMLPKGALVDTAGVSRQDRNWFWYRRTFQAPARRTVAVLRINKAQFGAAVWLNGKKVGEHLPCFSAAILDVSSAIRWTGTNELVVRIGAHPGVLPPTVTPGTDFEKNFWTPGIYDSVSLLVSDNPVIETVQAAPRIASGSVLVQTVVRNAAAAPVSFTLTHRVHLWKSKLTAGEAAPEKVTLAPGESKTLLTTIRLPKAKLWWPEDPNLYVIETGTGGDSASTRFGMREIRFDTATRRAWLNGRVYFLRGSNITLHRFFEDPLSGTLPWNEAWVRRLLVDIPKQMHWNTFRFCIGPVPDKWLDIADEAGLLIQNEYFVWTGRSWHGQGSQTHFDANGLIQEYREWMRDNWNHPSVAIWDANNETWDPVFGEKVIPAVRGLDLSHRAWENSYNPPAGPDDPIEDHPYEFNRMAMRGEPFDMTIFERPGKKGSDTMSGHAMILNEYGWLWLNRDGSPTELTKTLYPKLLGPNATADQRLELNAYLLGGITEYWRAYRQYAGVLHFVYLMSSDPMGYTADHFRNIQKLELNPWFRDYMSQAFRPLGAYLSFWEDSIAAGSKRDMPVMLINDEPNPVEGTLSLVLEGEHGDVVSRQSQKFSLAGLGQQTYNFDFQAPQQTGKFLLKAVAETPGKHCGGPTLSRRKVKVVAEKP